MSKSLKIKGIEFLLRDVNEVGFTPEIVINGEHYSIDFTPEYVIPVSSEEKLSCLTGKPCDVCKHHTDGCGRYSCIFDGSKTE